MACNRRLELGFEPLYRAVVSEHGGSHRMLLARVAVRCVRRCALSLSRATRVSGVGLNGQGGRVRVGERRCSMATTAGGVDVCPCRELRESAGMVPCSNA
jgi:hypothetical protein